MEVQQLKLSELQAGKGALMVRQVGAGDGIKELAANIERFGLIQPLLVTRNGAGYVVVDGNRRLAALRALKRPPETVDCVVKEDAGIGHGLSANTMRAEMNPMDRYDAYAKLVAQGLGAAEVAQAFGVKAKEVEQILALAALAPSIKDRVRQGKVSFDTAKALTIAGDHQTQERLLKRHGDYAWQIREALKKGAPDLRHALFDPKEYEAAGGKVLVDLFSRHENDGGERLAADPELFWKLQQPAIDAKVAALQKQGWKAVVRDENRYPNGYWNWPSTRGMKKADRANHTLRYRVHSDGRFEVVGRAEPARGAKPKKKNAGDGTDTNSFGRPVPPESFAGEEIRPFPQQLTWELQYQRGCQVKEAIASGFNRLGLRTLLYLLITQETGSDRQYAEAAGDLRWSDAAVEEADAAKMPGYDQAEKRFSEMSRRKNADLWARLAMLGEAELTELLNYAAAAIFDGRKASWNLGRLILAEQPIDGRSTFTPDEEFWGKTTKAYMLAQLGAVMGEGVAKKLGGTKTAELAKLMGKWFTRPEEVTWQAFGQGQPRPLGAELVRKFKSWVPAALALPTAEEAKAAVAKEDAERAEDDLEEFEDQALEDEEE